MVLGPGGDRSSLLKVVFHPEILSPARRSCIREKHALHRSDAPLLRSSMVYVELSNPADVISASRRASTLIFGLIVGVWPVSLMLGPCLVFSRVKSKDATDPSSITADPGVTSVGHALGSE